MANKKTDQNQPKKETSKIDSGFKFLNVDDIIFARDATYDSTDAAIVDVNSTGTVLNASIGSIYQRVDTIEHLLIDGSDKALFLLETELKALRDQTIPQLAEAKKTIDKVEAYLRENATFLTNLTSSSGRLQALESYTVSLSKRLEFLEGQKQTRWTNSATVISIIVSIISISIAVYAALKP